ncbi:MAG: hypothetical protein JST21_09290 [Bacteroidetes bacterium]|nr:hypothetical protein [Bacteroidota bacterium]
MVISKRYKFIFIELPQTATTAIAKELCQNFESESFLGKHSTYYEYCKAATEEEKKYTTVGSIRNPLDQAVSMFFKYKDDKGYHEAFSKGSIKRKEYGSLLRKFLSTRRNKERWLYINQNNPTFELYFLKYYNLPYSNWSILHHKQFNYIIRFEHLNDDYKRIFRELGVPIERDLPRTNVTAQKKKDFWSYIESDKAKKKAKFVFGPFMRYWGYEFPESWQKIKEPWYSNALYYFLNFFRKIYWMYLMPAKKARLQKSYYDDK